MLQSHATAYFYLVVPEMMFGMDAAPEQRNLLGLIEADPALMRRVIMLRKWGQEVIKTVFGRRMHGINSVPGGVDKNLSRAECDRLLNGEEGLPSIDEVIDYAQDGLRLFYDFHEKNRSAGRRLRRTFPRSTCPWSTPTATWTTTTACCGSSTRTSASSVNSTITTTSTISPKPSKSGAT